MLRHLHRNVYQFSVAKNYSQMRALTDALTDDEGRVRPFSDLQIEALKIDRKYNVDYLRAEYDTAVGAAEMASEWAALERQGGNPMLRYVTAGDERVRESHRVLDGLQRPMNDPIWNDIYPPNGWRCRCTVTVVAGAATPDRQIRLPKDIPPMFRTNLAKTGMLFPKGHPYFKGIDNKKLVKALEYIPAKNTYMTVETPNGYEIDINCMHNDSETAKNVAAVDVLLKNGIVEEVKLLPDIHGSEVAARKMFYPAGELPPDPMKNADALLDGHVWEIKTTVPKNIVHNINKAASQSRRVVIRLTEMGSATKHGVIRKVDTSVDWSNIDEINIIFPDETVENVKATKKSGGT